MHLVAGIPGPPSTQMGEKAGIGHLTPMDSGWLLGIVFEVAGTRLIANHIVPPHEQDPSADELAARIRALGVRLAAGSTTARHVLDAETALDAVRARVGRTSTAELSDRQLDIAYCLLGGGLQKALYVSDVAAACGVSEGHFRRAFRARTGVSPQQWRQERRIRGCRKQLAEGDESLASIARHAGFAAQSHFSRVFTQFTGMSPSEWRRLVRPAARAGNLGARASVYALDAVETCL